MKASGNTLVLFEEMGGDPTGIAFATKQVGSLCSHVTESHPLPVDMWSSDSKIHTKSGPTLSLECPFPNQVISKIKFVSYGTPSGTCGSFSRGRCSSSRALSIVEKVHLIRAHNCSLLNPLFLIVFYLYLSVLTRVYFYRLALDPKVVA